MEINKIYNENCLDTMRRMPDRFIDLTVTSPPYDNLREYKGYSFPFEEIAQELYRVTKEGGVVVWVVGDATINGSESGTSFRQALFFKEVGFNLYDTMFYEKASRIPTEGRYYNTVEYMFILSKGKPKALNFIVDHKNSTEGQNRIKDKCINKGKNEKKEGECLVTGEFSRRSNVWRYGTGRPTDLTKILNETGLKHPAIAPEKLAADHIQSWSNEGDLIYDCFGGSGTTAKMAHLLDRKWIMSEISKEYCDLAHKRLQPYLMQAKLFTPMQTAV
jgi:site-specific DNA-methyltransferase (adenine-specific)